jgi:autotransporter-associated beta strand protein
MRPGVDLLLPYFNGEAVWPYENPGYTPSVSPRVVFSWLQQAAVGYHDPSLWGMAMRKFGSYYYADSNLSTPYFEVCPFWDRTSGGTWSGSGNWTSPAIGGTGMGVYCGPKLSAPATVTLDIPVTLGTLVLEGTHGYTFVGNTLTLSATARPAIVQVERGSHRISTPLELASPLTAYVVAGSAMLTIDGPINGQQTITKTGSGTLVLAGTDIFTGSLAVNVGRVVLGAPQTMADLAIGASGSLILGGGLTRVTSLEIATTGGAYAGRIDILAGGLIVEYCEGQSPLEAVQAMLARGYAGGTWTGKGIAGSGIDPMLEAIGCFDNATFLGAVDHFGGRAVPHNAIVIARGLAGDVDMSGEVNSADYFYIDYNLDTTGGGWAAGDLDYSGETNSADYFYVDFNLNRSAGGATAIPEPATALLLATAAMAAAARRRWFR